MADKAKHAFGTLENVDSALSNGTIDSYDILFVKDANGKPYVGWIDKDGNKVIVDDSAELAELETQLKSELSEKADTEDVNAKIEEAVTEAVNISNAYADKKIETAETTKYEISHKPDGTLVDYRDKEIRIMCPANTEWVLQQSGEGADKSKYYIGFKAYSPNGAVSFKEDLAKSISDTTMYYFENNDFAGIDSNGRKYSIVWLPVAAYDKTNNTWAYYGAKSTVDKFIGWHYSVEWYDANGVVVASDCIRINLSNENCYSSIEPCYMGEMMKEFETMVDEKIAEADSAYEIIEF